jgi:hypothetical protein
MLKEGGLNVAAARIEGVAVNAGWRCTRVQLQSIGMRFSASALLWIAPEIPRLLGIGNEFGAGGARHYLEAFQSAARLRPITNGYVIG